MATREIKFDKTKLKCAYGHYYATEWTQYCKFCVDLKKILTRMANGS